jgi:type IX secretion system PorP/SprF family membrane protein
MSVKCIFVLILSLIFLNAEITAQQKPHYTQYMLNQYILNPALTGIEDYSDIRLSHRIQWDGFRGAPVTSYLTVNTSLGKRSNGNSASSVFSEDENPAVQKKWNEDDYVDPYHGIGIQLVNDVIGPFSHFSGNLTYAYHMSINSTTRLSGGLGLGFNRYGINTGKLDFGNNLVTDPVTAQQAILNGKVRMDLNAGLWLYRNNFFAGLAVHQLVPQLNEAININTSLFDSRNVPHYFFTAGYNINPYSEVRFIPSVMLKYIPGTPVQADLNVKAQFTNSLFLGASYRSGYGFAGMTGFAINNKLLISYSYDYTNTLLNQVSNGSHEIMIGFRLSKSDYSVPCPVGIW